MNPSASSASWRTSPKNISVGLAFEFLGQTDCSVQTLDLCNAIVEQVNRPNVGNVIDTFHFYAGNSSLEAIDRMKPEKLFIFHINDAEDLPKDAIDRRAPALSRHGNSADSRNKGEIR